jgi:hypothetical protein
MTQTTAETLERHGESAAFAPDDHAKLTGRLEASIAT